MRWVRRYWDEEDLWFYFELDDEGWVTRQIEFLGAAGTPVTAASMSEWFEELDAGRIGAYQARFGLPAEKPIMDELHEFEPVPADEFEHRWTAARRHLRDMD